MPNLDALQLAHLLLAVHLLVIVFNVGGLLLVPLGAWRGWAWVRNCPLRALHLLSMAVVAAQAAAGRACFFTLWQSALMQRAGRQGLDGGLIQSWVDRLIYWNLPLPVFTAIYLAVGFYTVLLWRSVPPRCARRNTQPSSTASAASRTSGQSP